MTNESLTEGALVRMLRSRYEQEAGNGVAGAVIPQVRNDAGFDAKRTLDAIAVSFWPSRGLLLEGFECKSSRSDWQRELKDPSKAEEFCEKVDKFWINTLWENVRACRRVRRRHCAAPALAAQVARYHPDSTAASRPRAGSASPV